MLHAGARTWAAVERAGAALEAAAQGWEGEEREAEAQGEGCEDSSKGVAHAAKAGSGI